MRPSCSRIRSEYRTLCWGKLRSSERRMIPIGWFSMIAFNIATCRCRSLTSASILLVSALLRVTENLPLQPVTWSVITWALLKGSTRGRCEERHVPIARFAPAAGRHRDDSDRDVLREQRESSIRRRLRRKAVRNPVVHELGEDLLDDLLADPGDGDRTARTRVQSGADDRRVADASRQHERKAAGR